MPICMSSQHKTGQAASSPYGPTPCNQGQPMALPRQPDKFKTIHETGNSWARKVASDQ